MSRIKKFLRRFLNNSKVKGLDPRVKGLDFKLEKLSRLVEIKLDKLNKQVEIIRKMQSGFLRAQKQPRLARFTIYILGHCNLNCKGCGVFSPLAEKGYMPLHTFQKDVAQMSLITGGAVTRITLQGGETLLHPDLQEMLVCTREAFKKTRVEILTNGILLLNQNQSFWDVCREYNIVIAVTKYPISLNYNEIEKMARANQVTFEYLRDTETVVKTLHKWPYDIEGLQDPKLNFLHCHRVNVCPTIVDGKFYPCAVIPAIVHFNRKFGTQIEAEAGDYLDLYSIRNYDEMLSYLTNPIPFCRYCKMTEVIKEIPYEQSKRDINEWT